MQQENIRLNDIADNLLVMNRMTIDTLFKLENCADCIALYVFYYKTAKWQKTNMIWCTDEYVKKALKWGIDKIRRTKQTLKESGLINIVQRRENGKISGWFIEVCYLVTEKKMANVKIKVDDRDSASTSKNTQNQQIAEPTNGSQETNALINKYKCLKNNIKVLEEEKYKKEFAKLWLLYPRKQGKVNAERYYIKARKDGESYDAVRAGIDSYMRYLEAEKIPLQYVKQGSTWFNQRCWNDEYKCEKVKSVVSSYFDEDADWESQIGL